MNRPNHLIRTTTLLSLGFVAAAAQAQHLWWKPKAAAKPATCIYGEIEVLATNPAIYYCGCNWWPGKPAGGYTGIQDPGGTRHNMIFSIWDTTPDLHPRVTEADSKTIFSRFGGEGTGAHTHSDYYWQLNKTYRYFAEKVQDSTQANTLTKLYFYDEPSRRWVHEATISNPNNGDISVPTFGGGLNAFLENWMGQDKAAPKLAVYRLWVGTTPSNLVNVTDGQGDGKWGVLNGSFYLAEGEDSNLAPLFKKYKGTGGVIAGSPKGSPLTVPERRIPKNIVRALEHLSHSAPISPDKY
jgi:hypothetical protein